MTPAGIGISTMIPFVLLLFGLGLTTLTDTYLSKTQKRIMVLILILTTSLIVQNVLDYLLIGGTPNIKLKTAVVAFGYAVRPAIIVLFCNFVVSSKKLIPSWILVAINTLVYLTAFFSPITFRILPDNSFQRGPLGLFCHVLGTLMLINMLFIAITKFKDKKRELIFPIVCIVLIILSIIIDVYFIKTGDLVFSMLTIAIVMSCIFYYFWFHMRSVRLYEKDLMAQQRVKIIVSQIQPHFLYNTITTFRALCKRDPEKAAEVAEKFGQYLRQNLDSLESEGLIPIDKEIEHTRVYADIEMVRFENLRVEYDIKDNSFCLPPLTVQPIVENSIRHGVRIRKEGVVCVSTRFSDGCHEIVISDNGIGFDVEAAEKTEGKHIGIKNVRERIEKLCGGTLVLESVPNVGTTVTIRIPETEEKK